MFIWFMFRDSAGNPWQSGLDRPVGHAKPAFAIVRRSRTADRRLDDHGEGRRSGPGDDVRALSGALLAAGRFDRHDVLRLRTRRARRSRSVSRRRSLAADQSVTFTPAFIPAKGQTYTVVATLNEANGHNQSRTAYITVS